MINKQILIDLDACVRCYACEIACRQENNLDPDSHSRWCRVITIEPRIIDDEMHTDFIPVMCFNCDDPACAYFCPVDAISKKEDGLVVIDENICTGCRQCVHGCPYGAMHFNEKTKVAGKCNLCISRMDFGIEPSCVQHCIGGALRFVSDSELKILSKGKHVLKFGRSYYLSSKWDLNTGSITR